MKKKTVKKKEVAKKKVAKTKKVVEGVHHVHIPCRSFLAPELETKKEESVEAPKESVAIKMPEQKIAVRINEARINEASAKVKLVMSFEPQINKSNGEWVCIVGSGLEYDCLKTTGASPVGAVNKMYNLLTKGE